MWRFGGVFFVLVVVTAHAQTSANPRNHTLCTLRVDVSFAGGGRAPAGLQVELLAGLANSSPAGAGLTNSSGSAEFPYLLPGDYRVAVSGEGIESAESEIFHIEDGRVFMSESVAVHRAGEANAAGAKGESGNVVKVSDLNVPKKAAEELARGDTEMRHNNWKKAAAHFTKATSLYPQYCSAYYNLSVAYSHLGRTDDERNALQKALSINDHFVPALVGLAHTEFAARKLSYARNLLDQALFLDQTNVDALALRVRVDFMQGQYEQTIVDARKVHSLPHQGYATVHYSAAAAYQRLNRIPEMIAELQTFLQEDPTSPSADSVRQTIAALENKSH